MKIAVLAKDYAVKLKYYRLSKDEFDIVKIIGQGGFGQVAVCKSKHSGKVFAMKTLNKHEMITRAEVRRDYDAFLLITPR